MQPRPLMEEFHWRPSHVAQESVHLVRGLGYLGDQQTTADESVLRCRSVGTIPEQMYRERTCSHSDPVASSVEKSQCRI